MIVRLTNDNITEREKVYDRKQQIIFAYSLFTAAQFLRRWFSVLTQTVTQTQKNQVDLSVPERMPL